MATGYTSAAVEYARCKKQLLTVLKSAGRLFGLLYGQSPGGQQQDSQDTTGLDHAAAVAQAQPAQEQGQQAQQAQEGPAHGSAASEAAGEGLEPEDDDLTRARSAQNLRSVSFTDRGEALYCTSSVMYISHDTRSCSGS